MIPLTLIIFTFLYKNKICHFINDQLLSPLNLEFIDDFGIMARIIYFSIIMTAGLYLYNLSKDWKVLIIGSIAIIGWIISWKSPFSEGKEMTSIFKKNKNWYYNDFAPIGECIRSNVGCLIPESHRENQNYISFSQDSIFITQKIKTEGIEFFYQIAEKFSLKGNKIIVPSHSIRVSCRFIGIGEYIALTNIDDLMDFSYLRQFPTVSNESEKIIKKVVCDNFLFQNLGNMNFYISDVNNRGGDYNFDCFYFSTNKELYYTKFSEDGYFNQVKIK